MKENYSVRKLSVLLTFIAISIFSFQCSKEESFEQANDGNLTISLKDSKDPVTFRLVQGGTVTWVNDDNMIHTVTNDNMDFNSGNMQPGGRFSVTFNEVGNYNFRCLHHPGMSSILVLTR